LSLLGRGLTSVNYLSTLSHELVITLIYNAEMPAHWGAAAALLREELLRVLTLSPVPASAPVPSPGVPAASLRQLSVIGRSRGSKMVVGRDWVLEELPKPIPLPVPLPPALQEPDPAAATGVTPADTVAHASAAGVLRYRQVDDGFSNPNSVVNLRALAWLCSVAGQITEGAGAGAGVEAGADAEAGAGGVDLLEMYCGNGNHTVALAGYFHRVLAVELSPSLCAAARYNFSLNGVNNAHVVACDSAHFALSILRKKMYTLRPDAPSAKSVKSAAIARTQGRARAAGPAPGTAADGVGAEDKRVDTATTASTAAPAPAPTPAEYTYRFGAVLVDPPRCGLDAQSCQLVALYPHVLYVSCCPDSLERDLRQLLRTHALQRVAIFDQFAYTPHIETGVWLRRREPPIAHIPKS